MKEIYIALGTNIEPRKEHLDQAIEALSHHATIEVIRTSSIYETAPVGYLDQASFLNMVVEVNTTLAPMELLDVCQGIEQKLGRKRTIRNGPRTIDLDILLYGGEQIDNKRLVVPHPRMHERAFVLIPLSDIANEARIPTVRRTVQELINELPHEDLNDVIGWKNKG